MLEMREEFSAIQARVRKVEAENLRLRSFADEASQMLLVLQAEMGEHESFIRSFVMLSVDDWVLVNAAPEVIKAAGNSRDAAAAAEDSVTVDKAAKKQAKMEGKVAKAEIKAVKNAAKEAKKSQSEAQGKAQDCHFQGPGPGTSSSWADLVSRKEK